MSKGILKKDSLIYLANIICFSLVYILKPEWKNIGTGVLIVILILSFLLIKQVNTNRNIWTFRKIQITNLNSFTMLILFVNLTFLHWNEFEIIEKIYLLTFSLIQISNIQIKKIDVAKN